MKDDRGKGGKGSSHPHLPSSCVFIFEIIQWGRSRPALIAPGLREFMKCARLSNGKLSEKSNEIKTTQVFAASWKPIAHNNITFYAFKADRKSFLVLHSLSSGTDECVKLFSEDFAKPEKCRFYPLQKNFCLLRALKWLLLSYFAKTFPPLESLGTSPIVCQFRDLPLASKLKELARFSSVGLGRPSIIGQEINT